MVFDKTKHSVAIHYPSLIQRSYHPNYASDSSPNDIVGEINQMAIVGFVELSLHEQIADDFSARRICDWVTHVSPQHKATEWKPFNYLLPSHLMMHA